MAQYIYNLSVTQERDEKNEKNKKSNVTIGGFVNAVINGMYDRRKPGNIKKSGK